MYFIINLIYTIVFLQLSIYLSITHWFLLLLIHVVLLPVIACFIFLFTWCNYFVAHVSSALMAIFLFITLEKYFDLLYEDVLETLSKMSKNVFVWRLEDNLKKTQN